MFQDFCVKGESHTPPSSSNGGETRRWWYIDSRGSLSRARLAQHAPKVQVTREGGIKGARKRATTIRNELKRTFTSASTGAVYKTVQDSLPSTLESMSLAPFQLYLRAFFFISLFLFASSTNGWGKKIK